MGSEVCGSDAQLQSLLVRQLVHADELEHSISSTRCDAPSDLAAELAAHQADRAAGITKAPVSRFSPVSIAAAGPVLRMPDDIPITFVTAAYPSSLARAAEGLSESATDMVGLDLEFGFTGASSSQPALLQIATRSQVFLFDLLSFTGCESMGQTLVRLFRSPRIRNVGYACCARASPGPRPSARRPT